MLAAQGVVTLTLSNSAFVDEGCYLFAGHTEWAALFGAASGMDYAAFFSGSPYLYPLIGAAANALGGLGAARGLSLVFMLGATIMLYRVSVLLFGRHAAIWAAALFSLCGPCLFMGHLATFDAPAVFLLASGLWLAVRSGRNKVLLLETTAVTTLAVMFKYATLVYTVPIVLVAAICAVASVGWRWAAVRAAGLWVLMLLAVGASMCIAGPTSVAGLMSTTLDRPPATNTIEQVAQRSAVYVGFILVLAVCGALWFAFKPYPADRRGAESLDSGSVTHYWDCKARTLLGAVLAGAALIASIGDMRLHTLTSLEKHAGYGLMFAAPMGGFLIDRLVGRTWWRMAPAVTLVCALGVYGANQAHEFYSEWPNSTAYINTLETVAEAEPAGTPILAENPWVERYYLGDGGEKFVWDDTYGMSYRDPDGETLSGLPAYQAAVSGRYFGVALLDYNATPGLDLTLDRLFTISGYHRTSVSNVDRYGRTDVEIWTLIGVRN